MDKVVNSCLNLIECFLRRIFRYLFKIINRDFSEETFIGIMQFVRFGIVGISNTFISYFIYAICLLFLKNYNFFENIDYLIAQGLSFFMGVCWSFYWNNRVVFKNEKRGISDTIRKLTKTFVSYSFTGLFLNSILLILWVKFFYISQFIAPIINLLVSVPINFLLNKYWAFK